MIKPVKTILFATNLTRKSMAAFDIAAAIATRFQATLVMLHVIEKMPDYVENQLKGLLGQKEWEELYTAHIADARQKLMDKKASNVMIKSALARFCRDTGIDAKACGYHSLEIVVSDGEVIDEVVRLSKEYHCDLIVMGLKTGVLSHNAIGPKTKGVMRTSKIPVLVVPPVVARGPE